MEQYINIVDLLKDCPSGTKLYSLVSGEVEFIDINKEDTHPIIVVSDLYGNERFTTCGHYRPEGDCLLFPSNEIRDWRYFKVKYCFGNPNRQKEVLALLKANGGKERAGVYYNELNSDEIILYIDSITHFIDYIDGDNYDTIFNYILSTGTELKLEEEQPKFKVGDVVATKKHTTIGMVERLVCEGAFINYSGESTTTCRIDEIRLATPEEIDKWNEEVLHPRRHHYSRNKRKIINWFLPFDRVLVRDSENENWSINIFSYYVPYARTPYMCLCDPFSYCLPYNEKTAKLIGTTDNYEEK